jgi:hypothetical protein
MRRRMRACQAPEPNSRLTMPALVCDVVVMGGLAADLEAGARETS